MPNFCTSSNSITSPSFRCWSIPVSEICEFNQKKEREEEEEEEVEEEEEEAHVGISSEKLK